MSPIPGFFLCRFTATGPMAFRRFVSQSREVAKAAWCRSPKSVAGTGIAAFLVLSGIFFYLLFFMPSYTFPAEKIFEVQKGASLSEIAHSLHENNIIRAPSFFIFLVKAAGKERDVKAGLYYFEKPLSLTEVMFRLTVGNYEVEPFQSTIQEGATIFGMGLFFEEKGMFTAKDFWRIAGLNADHYGNGTDAYMIRDEEWVDFQEVLSIKPAGAGFEGFLFPDTYFFPPAIKPGSVIRAMLENFERKVTDEMHEEATRQKKDFYDILIMASIIEREAFDGEDGKIISGILWKRLRENYPLQVDAALSYITGRGSFQLTLDDLEIDSPYNVYARVGLPPTPISNPGIEAIEAALYPQESDYWYYLHDGGGKAYYAKTFEEHKSNKSRYLR